MLGIRSRIRHPRPSVQNTGALSSKAGYPTYSGSPSPSTNGATITGVRFTSSINITGNDVTVSDCHMDGGAITVNGDRATVQDVEIDGNNTILYPLRVQTGAGPHLLEDIESRNATSICFYKSGGGQTTARRLWLHESLQDGARFDGGDLYFERSLIQFCGTQTGSHADGMQMGIGSNVDMRYNFFDLPENDQGDAVEGVNYYSGYAHNTCILLEPNAGDIDDIRILHNWFSGELALVGNDPNFIQDIWIGWNLFHPDNYASNAIRTSPVSSGWSLYIWGNRWYETGLLSSTGGAPTDRTTLIQYEELSANNTTGPGVPGT